MAIASMTGTPNPSCCEATTSTSDAAIAPTRSSSLTWPRKVTASRRPSSSTNRRRAREYAGTTGRPMTWSVAAESWWRVGHQEGHQGQLDALVGGDPADGEPAARRQPASAAFPGARAAGAVGGVGAMAAGGTTAVRAYPCCLSSASLNWETATAKCRSRSQAHELLDSPELVPGHRVVPGGVVLGRGDVVVADGQRLPAPDQPGGDVRGGGELVQEEVAPLGVVVVRRVQPGVRGGVGIDHLDVDVRLNTSLVQHVSDAQGVAADGVVAVQHRHELVDGCRHRRVRRATGGGGCGPDGPRRGAGRGDRRSVPPSCRARALRLAVVPPGRAAVVAAPRRRRVGVGVGEQVRDGVRHHVGVPGGDEDPGVTSTSGMAPWSKATTGNPAAMASTTGTQKPSCSEATTRTSDVAYASATVASLA